MKQTTPNLITPFYLKMEDDMPWPEDKMFYLMSANGLFRCRNHPFFRSCVQIKTGPRELAQHHPFLRMKFPKISQPLMEQIIGFFSIIADKQGSEAAVLIGYDQSQEKIIPIIPDQVGTVSSNWNGQTYPIDVLYEIPPLPAGMILIGDIHSHVDGPAYTSMTDEADEVHRPGFHLVIGRINEEPPQFHCEATVDGARFPVKDLSLIMDGYEKRRNENVPQDWVDKVKVKPWTEYNASNYSTSDSQDWSDSKGQSSNPAHS